MKKVGKLEIRRIWVIYRLLDGKKLFHDDLTNYLNEVDTLMLEKNVDEMNRFLKSDLFFAEQTGRKLPNNVDFTIEQFKSDLGSSDRKVSKEMLSKVLKSLRNDGIICRKIFEKEGRGPDPYEYSLIDNFSALKRILDIFHDPKINKNFSNFLMSSFISSSYAKKMIPLLLEGFIEKMNFSFNDSEKELVLNILLSSPRAVFFTLEIMKLPNIITSSLPAENETGDLVDRFLLELQLKLGEDMMHLVLPKSIKPFEYKITVSFTEDQLERNYILKVIERGSIQTKVLPKFSEDVNLNSVMYSEYSPI